MVHPLRSTRPRCGSRRTPLSGAVVLAPTPGASSSAHSGTTHRTGSPTTARDLRLRRRRRAPGTPGCAPTRACCGVRSQGEPHHPAVADGAAGGVVPVALLVLGIQRADDAPTGVVVAGGAPPRSALCTGAPGGSCARSRSVAWQPHTQAEPDLRGLDTDGADASVARAARARPSACAVRVSPSETDRTVPSSQIELVVGGRHGRVARRRPEQQPENPDRDPRAAKALPHAPPLPLIGIGAIPPSRTGSMLTGRSPVPSHPRSPPRRRTGPRCPRASPRRRHAGSPARCRARSSPGRRRLRAGGSVRPCPCRRSG